jgi:CDP-L-myo-inositol myo-inositolphosphotransferase
MVVFNAALAQSLRQFEVESDRLLVPDENHRSLSRFSGLALCQAASFQRLQAEIGNGRRDRVVDAILAPISPLVVPGHGWIKVDSRESEKEARRLLRLSMFKPSDGFFSRHLNRKFSWPMSRLLIRLGVRPNHITVANLALGLLSGWLIGRGGYGNTLAAGLLFQFVSIFDGCDGEIARLTFRFSALGAKLDNLCDFITLVVFFINLPIGLYAATANLSYLALGVAVLLAIALFYLLLLARIKLSGHHGNIAEVARQVQEKNKSGRPLSWLEWLGVRLGFMYRKEFISLYAMAWCIMDLAVVVLWTTSIFVSMGLVYEIYSISQLIQQPRRQKDA